MKTDLIVIDMQPEFETSDPIVDDTIREINRAKKRKANIILVEYIGCGRTNKRITDTLKQYPQVKIVRKDDDGGGRQVLNAYKKIGIIPEKIRVVGVNRSYCVHDTIKQLIRKIPALKVEVSISATNCNNEGGITVLEQLGCKMID